MVIHLKKKDGSFAARMRFSIFVFLIDRFFLVESMLKRSNMDFDILFDMCAVRHSWKKAESDTFRLERRKKQTSYFLSIHKHAYFISY